MAQATATKALNTENLGDTLLVNWTENFDRVCNAQKELEDLVLQILESQKESWSKLNVDLTRTEEEQKKLLEDLRESTKLNLQKVFGQTASKAFDQLNAQFEEVSSRIQELTVKPYKEGVNIINQSQEQFQQSVKSGFEQQQKIREDFNNQVKSTQKIYFDLYEANTKIALGLFK